MFLESAKNVISEDCLLGLGYLLNLRENCIKGTQTIFEDLPPTDLNLQLALYCFSLQLFKKVNPSDINMFSYDPIELICGMSKIKESDETREFISVLRQQIRLLSASSEIANEADIASEIEIANENKIAHEPESIDSNQKHSESPSDQTEEKASVGERKVISQNLTYNVDDGDGWDEWENEDWGDFPGQDVKETKDNTMDEIPSIRSDTMMSLCENATEEERFEGFEKMFREITNKHQYLEVKETLKQWPDFIDSENISANKNPVLRLLIKAVQITDKTSANYDSQVLEEIKDLLTDQEIPKDVSPADLLLIFNLLRFKRF